MSTFECSICFGKYTHKKYFNCKSCKTTICCNCLKSCLIVYGTTIPRCPSCNETISYLYLTRVFSKKFVKQDLFNHLASIEFEVLVKEKIKLVSTLLQRMVSSIKYDKRIEYTSLLNRVATFCGQYSYAAPRLQPEKPELYNDLSECIIDIYINRIKDLLEKYEPDNKEYTLYNIIKDGILMLFNIMDYDNILKIFSEKLPQYFDEKLLRNQVLLIESNIRYEINKLIKSGNSSKTKFIFRCTVCEYGFIDTNYVCSSCNNKFCENCLQPLNEEHECLKEDIETLEMIFKETKPCPNCFTRIYKISGCSQMFCTYCKTGFDWITGKKITNNFHNPHRMEWLANGGADDLPDFNCINDYAISYIERHADFKILVLYNYSNHIRDKIENFRYLINEENIEFSELMLLVKYLFSKYIDEKSNDKDEHVTKFKEKKLYLTETEFKRKLSSMLKRKNKYEIYLDVYETMDQILRSSLIRIDQILALSYSTTGREFIINKENQEQIKNLVNNCYEFIHNIESERIIELEQQMDLRFDKLVIYDDRLRSYYWNTNDVKINNYQEILDFINMLTTEVDNNVNDNTNIRYKKLNAEEIDSLSKKQIYNICKYIKDNLKEENKIDKKYISNLDNLSLTLKEKNLIYTLLFK